MMGGVHRVKVFQFLAIQSSKSWMRMVSTNMCLKPADTDPEFFYLIGVIQFFGRDEHSGRSDSRRRIAS
jgi:hypothetical protein